MFGNKQEIKELQNRVKYLEGEISTSKMVNGTLEQLIKNLSTRLDVVSKKMDNLLLMINPEFAKKIAEPEVVVENHTRKRRRRHR